MEKILNTLIWAAILQGLLLGLHYFFSKRHSSLANKLLGLFLLAFVFEALTILPLGKIEGYSTSGYFSLPEVKLFFPVLFLNYILEKVGRSRLYNPFLKSHYILALCFVAITFFNGLLYIIDGRTIYQLFEFQVIEVVFMIMQYYAFFLTIAAIAIAIYETLRYTELVKNAYSDLDMLQIRWLWQFILGVIPITIVWGLELVRVAVGGRGPSDYVSITWLLIVIFIYFLSYKAYQKANLIESESPELRNVRKPKIRSEDRSIKDYEKMGLQLNSLMESGQFYLQHDLTLYDLSKEFKISSRLISECVNGQFKHNFTEWVNNFRVDEAIARLKDPSYDHLSVEGIGSDAGFKSRSAMYAAFKKKTGQSPGYFRKE